MDWNNGVPSVFRVPSIKSSQIPPLPAMRRKDKAITDAAAIKTLIAKTKVCRLAMVIGDKPSIFIAPQRDRALRV